MIHDALSWWLDDSPVRRWGLPVAFLLTAALIDVAFDRTWLFGWGSESCSSPGSPSSTGATAGAERPPERGRAALSSGSWSCSAGSRSGRGPEFPCVPECVLHILYGRPPTMGTAAGQGGAEWFWRASWT